MSVPKDWRTITLGELGSFSKGSGILKSDVQSEGIPCIRYGEIYTVHNEVIKKYNSYITRNLTATSRRLVHGDILFAGSGETKEEIGKATVFLFEEEAYAGGDIVIFNTKSEDAKFLSYLLNSEKIVAQKMQAGKGDAVVHISASDLSKITFALPSNIEEQKAIAKALSDIDDLISQLGLSILKRENIFAGLLQEMFEISSSCSPVAISLICEIQKGCATSYNKELENGEYGFLNGGIEFSGFTSSFNDPGDTVVVSEGGNSCGFVNYIKSPFWCGGHAYRLLNFEGSQRYLYFAMKSKESEIMNLRVGSGLPNVQKKNLAEFEINVHTQPSKQKEVVGFLDVASEEILALKNEKSKYECIKQGMMNDLLTGKVRLA